MTNANVEKEEKEEESKHQKHKSYTEVKHYKKRNMHREIK